MKISASVLFCLALVACSKKDTTVEKASAFYQIRIAAVESNGSRSYSPTTRVKSGKVAIEFETGEASGIAAYNVEVSTDGRNFTTVKRIASDALNPNKLYSDTLVLE